MSLSLEQLVSQLQSGADLGSLAAASTSPELRQLLGRCSLVRGFDRQLLAAVLDASSGVPFEELIAHPAVERLPRSSGRFRVRADHPAVQVPGDDELRQLSRTLAEHFAGQGPAADIDRLQQLATCDPSAAAELFDRLYREADEAFHLARCQDLVAVLDTRRERLDTALRQRADDCRQFLAARSFWAEEYYQTARYLQRPRLEAAFEQLLAGDGPWVLQLHAPGGRGKTMALRWLLARRLVPQRIPCARLDFDLIDPQRAAQAPWRFLGALAEQLDLQIPGSPLRELIDEVREAARAEQVGSGLPPEQLQRLALQVPDRFASTLHDTCRGRPVVLVLDTLEQALLRHQTDLCGLVTLLATLHAVYPGLRLVLAGRYDLRQRLGPESLAWSEQAQHQEVPAFDETEAMAYLRGSRGLPESAPLAAIVRRAEGSPFKLGLFADLLQLNPQLSAGEIDSYDQVDLLYLVERVLEHIPDGRLHWVLRYGSVPRRLTFAFLSEVMAAFLPPALAGQPAGDDPTQGLPPRPAGKTALFPGDLLASPAAAVDYRQLWQQLQRYAGDNAWISAAGGEPDTLVIHGDVLHPMRQLLAGQGVWQQLHQAAAEHFEARAEAEPPQRLAWLREALYHRFQLAGPEAAGTWRRLLAAEHQTHNVDGCRQLAEEVLGPEYLDEDGQPRQLRGAPILDRATLALARFTLAEACVTVARQATPAEAERLWRQAGDELHRLQPDLGALDREEVSPARRALLAAALAVQQGRSQEALEQLERTTAAGPDEQLSVCAEHARLLAKLARPEAVAAFEHAVELARRPGDETLNAQLRLELSYPLECQGRLAAAERACQPAKGRRRPELKTWAALALRRCELLLELGRPTASRDVARKLQHELESDHAPVDLQVEAALACHRAQLRRGDVLPALEGCDALLQRIESQRSAFKDTDRRRALTATTHMLRAAALGELLEIRNALAAIEQARHRWHKLARPDRLLACRELAVRILLIAGQVRDAGSELITIEALESDPNWLRCQLHRAEWLERNGDASQAHAVRRELRQRTGVPWPPQLRAEISLAELASPEPLNPQGALERLEDQLRQLDDPGARLHLLRGLSRCPPLPATAAASPAARALRELVEEGQQHLPPGHDSSLLAPAIADLHRVLGQTPQHGKPSLGTKNLSKAPPESSLSISSTPSIPSTPSILNHLPFSAPGTQPPAHLTLRLERGGGLEIIRRCTPGQATPWPADLARALTHTLLETSARSEVFSYALLKDLQNDPEAFAGRLGHLLLGGRPLAELRRAAEPPDLRLEVEPQLSTFDALPWENLLLPGPLSGRLPESGLVRCFYRSTEEAISQEHRSRWEARRPQPGGSGEPPWALMLRSGLQLAMNTQRGGQLAGVDLVWAYQQAGFELEVLEDQGLSALEHYLRQRPPLVLHLCATLKESSLLGGVHLDFAREWNQAPSDSEEDLDVFNATTLDLRLKALPPEVYPPMVVLDVDPPPGRSERLRQLFLRNALAAQLFTRGTVPAVLAMGPLEPDDREAAQATLLGRLAAGANLAEVMAELNKQPGAVEIPPALFAHDPDFRPVDAGG